MAFAIVAAASDNAMRVRAFAVSECIRVGDVVDAKINRPRSFVDDLRRERTPRFDSISSLSLR
ncbi:hypothetical protein [Burkholderia sp. IMCC1007]|uniref:hypothetical protein n=1 Tax=Burkholderia sp. IMCC1007 TaxID=3004104 RepID=UPI0022B54EDD|nr:hypothetical protein [Burkholderia sp. IMCC1007]